MDEFPEFHMNKYSVFAVLSNQNSPNFTPEESHMLLASMYKNYPVEILTSGSTMKQGFF